jgi:hypothetical protein
MKKLLFILLLFSLKGFAQNVPFSSLTNYSGNLDSVRYVGILKAGNVWTNRTFYGIDLIKGSFKYSDTASAFSGLRSFTQNNFALLNHSHVISDVAGLQTSLNGKLNSSDSAAMLSAYRLQMIANAVAIGLKLNISDTGSMLVPYAKLFQLPTNNSQLSNGAGYITSSAIAGKLNTSDTANMLHNYLLAVIANAANISTNTSAVALKLNKTDTSTMLTPYRTSIIANQAALLNVGRIVISDNVQHANTGSTTENTVYTGTIKANSLGANGAAEIRVLISWPANANNKTFKIKVNGTIIMNVSATSSSVGNWMVKINNRNSTSSQVFVTPSGAGAGQIGWGTAAPATAVTTAAWDTTQDLTITVTIQNAVGTDSPALESIQVITFYKD